MKITFILIPSLLTLCIPLFNKIWIQKCFIHLTWPILLLLCLFFLYALIKLFPCRPNFPSLLKKYSPPLFFCLILSLAVFKSVEVKFKTLSDETNLLAKSRSLSFEKKPLNMTEAKNYFKNTHPLNYELPKRPLLFPFTVSILHNLLGYHPSNVFLLNFFTLFVFLSLFTLAGTLLFPPVLSFSIPL